MMNIFDTHAHYDDSAFEDDRLAVLSSLPGAGVCGVINCGCSVQSSLDSIALAQSFPFIHAACGIHPEDALGWSEADLDVIASLLDDAHCVAVGEIGLDYHWKEVPRETQLEIFERQLAMAKERDMPVIIHDREAHGDTLELVTKYRPRGVMHCYSGSLEMMRDLLEIGMYIGLGGAVTFKNAKKPVECAGFVPLDRLLLETDCPYMSPVPYRGKRCDSSMIALTAAKIAEVRGMDINALLEATKNNAIKLFNI